MDNTSKVKLSVVISSFNNASEIRDCINSVKFAQEIILIDNGSIDSTSKIAESMGAKVYFHQNNPDNLNQSKNYGFSLATNNWILSLDTDEIIDPCLETEIKHVVESTTKYHAFDIPRKNIIFGKQIQHGLWYPDYQRRLFTKNKGKFNAIHNHEVLSVKGEVGKLKGHIIHQNYTSISQYLQKIDRQYSNNEAEVFLKAGKKIYWYDALRFPFQDFLANYFARSGYKDGLHGLVLSILQSFYMFVVFCKIWEKEGFKQEKIDLKKVKSEFSSYKKQIKYWFYVIDKRQASKYKKIFLKLKHKLF